MSSYSVSPFEIERRRLAGIVSQCQAELDRACDKIQQQMNLLNNMYQKFADEDAEFEHRRVSAIADHFMNQENARQNEEAFQQRMMKKLEEIRTDLEICEKNAVNVSETRKAYDDFRRLYDAGMLKNVELEVKVNDLHNVMVEEITRRHQTEIPTSFSDYYQIKSSQKSVSLSLEEEKHENRVNSKKTLLDCFAENLKNAAENVNSRRVPALGKLLADFKQTPEYARTAFAVKNMAVLEKLLDQLKAIEDNEKKNSKVYIEQVFQYKSLCGLMGVEMDFQLISDERNHRTLARRCKELFERYSAMSQQKYVTEAVTSVMKKHEIEFYDSEKSAFGEVLHYKMDSAVLDITGAENNQLIMEVSGVYSGNQPTMNERRKSAASAVHFCSQLKLIEEELRDNYGITFIRPLREEPDVEAIAMRKDTHVKSGSKQHITKNLKSDSIN